MNRVSKITIAGIEFPMCFTVSAQDEFSEKCGSVEKMMDLFDENDSSKTIDNTVWLLSVLIKCGIRHEKVIAGLNHESYTGPDILPYETLRELIGFDDLLELQNALMDCIGTSTKPTVEAEPEKKTKATQ